MEKKASGGKAGSMPTLRRGMRLRRAGSTGYCSVGPYFSDGKNLYCFTVQHGIGGMGDRVVEANLDGSTWRRVGQYVLGVQDKLVDWALVLLDEDIAIDQKPPTGIEAPATGIGYYYSQSSYGLFKSAAAPRGDLTDGGVSGSPTYKDQYQCVTRTGSTLADSGVSGMGVYTVAGGMPQLLGIEWAIFWNGPLRQHTFYVQPFENVAQSLISEVNRLDTINRESKSPALVWSLVKPLADVLKEEGERGMALDFVKKYTI